LQGGEERVEFGEVSATLVLLLLDGFDDEAEVALKIGGWCWDKKATKDF